MCRMLAWSGHIEHREELLLQFQQLSINGKSTDGKGHRDGWGIGWYSDRIHLFKKAECAAVSTLYKDTVRRVKNENPRILLAHVRKASPGTPVTDKEAHPFQYENLLFCHNGSLFQPDDNPLGEELDTILFFKKINETSFEEAIHYFRGFKYTSLTSLLTDGNIITGYRDFKEKEEYYTLYYLEKEEYVLFCSEPLIQGEWILIRNGEMVTCHEDLEIEVSTC